MGNVRKLVKDIDRGIDLQRNLPIYMNVLSETYGDYASIELAFSVYILSEMIDEQKEELSNAQKQLFGHVLDALRSVVEDKKECAACIESIENIRNQITDVMEIYTSYTDCLVCYDYALKRMHLEFVPDAKMEEEINSISEEDFLRRLMNFAAGDKDQSVIRERFQMLMGEIPVRMTKSKFLEKLNGAITLYNGSDKASLDEFIYMVRSSAMLTKTTDVCNEGNAVAEFVKKLQQTDLTELTSSEYQTLCDEMEKMSLVIVNVTDYLYSLQKVVNGLLAVCILKKHKTDVSDTMKICNDILIQIASDARREDSLVKLEGKIEKCVEKSSVLEAVLFETKSSYKKEIEELGMTEKISDYAKVANLLSDSLFIDLDNERNGETVDMEYVKKVSAEISTELSELFGKLSKPLKRAVMASILEKVPVDFARASEMEEYIRTNLFGCQNASEKGVVMLELKDVMDEALDWRD